MKKVFSVLALLIQFVVLLGLGCLVYSEEANEIEPGWRVGPIIITMTQRDIERIYGNGELYIIPDVDKTVSYKTLQYKNIGLNFIFRNEQLEQIEINYPNFAIKGIVKVGSSVSRVEEVLGKNYIRENYEHFTQSDLPDYKMIYAGITFYVKADRIVKIMVTRQK